MMLFLSLFLLALAAASPSDGQELKLQRGDCPMFWYGFNGRCYKYVASRMTWADAELHCVSQGANLVSIHNIQDNDFVRSLIMNFDPTKEWTWIGLTDMYKEGGWMWTDGSKFSFTRWDRGQPDDLDEAEHCGHINFADDFNWNDYQCSYKSPFVCVLPKDCPKQ